MTEPAEQLPQPEGPVMVAQRPAGDLEAVASILHEAFVSVRDALGAARSVVVVVEAADLLGQRGPNDAAVAGGLLGLVRAVTFEGVKAGWQANVLAVDGAGPDPDAALLAAACTPGLRGQVLNVGAGHPGKVIP